MSFQLPYFRPSPFVSGLRKLLKVSLALGAVGCGAASTTPETVKAIKELPLIEAEVVTVGLENWPAIVRSYGSLIPDEVAVLGSRIEGRVESVQADLGDHVAAGTALVTLSQTEFRLRVEQAEAQLLQARSAVGLRPGDLVANLQPENAPPVVEQKALWKEAQANLDRAQQLLERKSISATEMEQITATAAVSEARYRSALNAVHEKIALIGVREAELSLAREQLADTVIVAAFDGLVQQKHVSPGSYVRVGDPVATLVRTNRLRFRGTIPERYALQLSVGQPVELQIESVNGPLNLSVTRISPAVDLSSRALLFEAVVENADGRIRSGLFAEARIVTDAAATDLVVPQSAVVEFAGAEKVWKVVNGETREQQVLAGERREDQVLILQGLSPGDVILRDGKVGMPAKVNSRPASENPVTAVNQ